LAQELQELLMTISPQALTDHLPSSTLSAANWVGRAIALVVVRHRAAAALLHR
jgi:hypothetical protein